MKKLIFCRLLIWAGVLVFFSRSVYVLLKAREFTPADPFPVPIQDYDFGRMEPSFPSRRYQKLLAGGMFFDEVATTKSFHTKLVLWGVINGVTAVVGTDPNSNADTVLVKVGDEVGGERIVAIGKGYIIVKNPSGEGVLALGE